MELVFVSQVLCILFFSFWSKHLAIVDNLTCPATDLASCIFGYYRGSAVLVSLKIMAKGSCILCEVMFLLPMYVFPVPELMFCALRAIMYLYYTTSVCKLRGPERWPSFVSAGSSPVCIYLRSKQLHVSNARQLYIAATYAPVMFFFPLHMSIYLLLLC